MRYPHNIEGSKYGKSYRVGYDSKGYAWRIHNYDKTGSRKYYCTAVHPDKLPGCEPSFFYSGSLQLVSDKLLTI